MPTITPGHTFTNGELVTAAKLTNLVGQAAIETAANVVLGRATAGTGPLEEIPCSAFSRSLMAASSLSAWRSLLEIGTAANYGLVVSPGGSPPSGQPLNTIWFRVQT